MTLRMSSRHCLPLPARAPRAKPGRKTPRSFSAGARPNLSYPRIKRDDAINKIEMSAKELKALKDKDIQIGDWVWLPYRGGKREGHVQKIAMSTDETPHPPKVTPSPCVTVR